MKKYIYTTIIFSVLFEVCFGQTPWYSNYKFSNKILDKLSKDSSNYEAAQNLSYIGEYKNMLKIWDRNEGRISQNLTSTEIKDFSKYKAVNAKELILKKAKNEQIIIINEAHQQPYHRVFTTSLLKDLYNAGFRYFGVEGITNSSRVISEIEINKYPTFNSGIYIREPFYGNLIREAINNGFEIFAYETTVFRDTARGGREIEQAKNIKKILDRDPKAKIFIYCGWDHIIEAPHNGWGKAMAGRLAELTGINPFTINQTKLTEHSSVEYQNAYWSSLNLDYDAMFIDSKAQIFYGNKENKQFDALIYHPKTKWIYGRPNWVFLNSRTPYFLKEKITLTFPCLVFAFLSKEKEDNVNAIPFDIIELKSPTDKKALSLKKGQKFTIIIRDENSNEQTFNTIVN